MFDQENDTRRFDTGALMSPDPAAPLESAGSEPPLPSMHARLVDIWREVLGVSAVGIHDDFFDLGGNSISAMRIVSRVVKEFNVELPINAVFDAPTIAQFAHATESALRTAYL